MHCALFCVCANATGNYKMINIVILLLSLFSTLVCAQQINIVTEEIPPFQMRDNNNQLTGALVEVVHRMLEEAQLTADIKTYPWARSYQIALNEKNTIIFSLFRSEKREKKFQWIGKLYTLNSYIATLSTRTDVKIDSLENAKNYSLGTIRSDLAQSYLIEHGFVPNKNLFISSKYNVLWEQLYSGRIDSAFTNDILWHYEITSLGLNPKHIKLSLQVPNFANDLYIAASLPTDKHIVVKLTEALNKLKASGRYQAILDKWHL